MAAVCYGTVAIVPKGIWDSATKYEVGNLVTYNGSSYVVHTDPPAGTVPTNASYWQISAQGGGTATADAPGVVKPDGTTTDVDENGAMSAKLATQTTPGIVKGSADVNVGDGGVLSVNTQFEQATELANIIAGEAIAQVLGKVSKAIATTMSLDQNALLKNMLSSIDVNDVNKVPTSAYIHTLVERIGMGTSLSVGNNLTDAVNGLNSRYLNNAGAHNAIYRGKYLGSVVTEAQWAAIKAGTFEDMYIGDYWTINGIDYRIAAFDYYLNCGDTNCTTHHVVIVPDTCLYNHVMNDTNITTGGYVGSKMYTEGLEQANITIKAAFSGHILSHRVYLTNVVADGHPSACGWYDSEVDLMNEQMVYGGAIFMPISNGSAIYTNYRVEKSQLPLFAHDPSRICNWDTWWLRDVVTASNFASVYNNGSAAYNDAVDSRGVRPAFCIC